MLYSHMVYGCHALKYIIVGGGGGSIITLLKVYITDKTMKFTSEMAEENTTKKNLSNSCNA